MARKKKSPISELNVVPYIDVMLVLLIIFMVAAPMLNQGIDVKLPKAEGKNYNLTKDDLPIIITAKSNGEYFIEVNGETSKASIDVVIQRTIEERKNKPKLKVLVKADEDIEYKNVINIMDSLNKNNITDFGLLTKK